jgi:hypothetical protein
VVHRITAQELTCINVIHYSECTDTYFGSHASSIYVKVKMKYMEFLPDRSYDLTK